MVGCVMHHIRLDGYVGFCKKLNERALERADETRRFNVDLLRRFQLFLEVFDFCDVELGDKRVDAVALFVDEPCIFKFCAQM